MASVPSEPRSVLGRLDEAGRLIAADPELELLQREAGSALGQKLALPQVAAIAEIARRLGTAVTRPAIAATAEHDIELWVHAVPDGDDVVLSLEEWTWRPAASPKVADLLAGGDSASGIARREWAADEELRIISLSPDLAQIVGVNAAEAATQPLTRIIRLEEGPDGEMPLMNGLAARGSFSGQRARGRGADARIILLSGDVIQAADGRFAGFRGTAELEEADTQGPDHERSTTTAFDRALEDVLRSPLDRIISNAEQIVEQADGPLRRDYAAYGNDIAAAARHLLSVVNGMSAHGLQNHVSIDLSALAAEALMLIEPSAQERGVTIELESSAPLPANGEERSVIQILVNLIGNAARHSPDGGRVRVGFDRTRATASVTVSDEGSGIAPEDQERIFARFERVDTGVSGTGLGLAICRRLARSMGGDVKVESSPGQGARFTLTLPAA